MTDLLIRLALILAGSGLLMLAFALTVAPHLFFVALRFVLGAIGMTAALAFALMAALAIGLASIASHITPS